MKAFAFSALVAGAVAALVVAGSRVDASSLETVETQNVKAPSFSLKTADGKAHTLESLTKDADEVVFYFIGHTCPINTKAYPYVHQFANTANGKKVKFVGILDGGKAETEAWIKKSGAKYPILVDAEKNTIAAFGAQRSPWFVVVDKKGNVVHTDKGYSADQLKSLSDRIAKVEGKTAPALKLEGAPTRLTYG